MGGPAIIDGKSCSAVDNFLPAIFVVNGIEFASAESYFQYQKCVKDVDRKRVLNGGCGIDVWKVGSTVELRKDWEEVKVKVMYEGNVAKFQQNPELAEVLVATKGKVVFHASSNFWCTWNGLIMELIREELKPKGKQDKKIIKKIHKMMDEA